MDACERYLNAIHELVDGTLGPIRRAELELHLEGCDGCRALAADLQEIARSARSLDVLEPPEHVWKSIAGRLRTERGMTGPSSALGRHRSMAMLAIAAALVLAVGASLFMLRTPVRRRSRRPQRSRLASRHPATRRPRIPSKASSRSWR